MSKIKTFGSHLVDFSIIPDNGVFIDAGACQGNFIDDIQKHVREPFIIAIEPNKENFKNLLEKRYERILILGYALVGSCEPKRMKFDDFGDAGLPEWGNVTGLYKTKRHITYDVDTIDIKEVLAYSPTGVVDHLKMDIEGSEYEVVADLTTSDAEKIIQISMEVHGRDEVQIAMMEAHLKIIGYRTQFEKGELYAVRKEL